MLLASSVMCGCGAPEQPDIPDRAVLSSARSLADVGGMEVLIAAAKAEGRLNAIAMPEDWANYGGIIAGFEKKYGIDVTVENPDGSSQDAIRALQENRPEGMAVDVLEVGMSQARDAEQQDLFARYTIERDGAVPEPRKDPGAAWYANYGGYVSLGCTLVHVRECPRTFADLLKPEYKGKVALNGDPAQSNSALAGVIAAALANDGSFNDVAPGVEFFRELTERGNYIAAQPSLEAIKNGSVPIVIDWDFKTAKYWEELVSGQVQWVVQVPVDGVFSTFYATAVNREAAHPAAARLWQEYLFSDEAQNLRLQGYARPVLMEHMEKEETLDVVSAGWLPKIPPHEPGDPTREQLTEAKKVVVEGWRRATRQPG
ncbi:extracellular solute-binding protein [Streptomyces hydrogenans]|uniref:extracellular solute-binding protein n=1 Tax=Streptomyces hydrogenans TaxID=1873719 RepID=UPI0036695460